GLGGGRLRAAAGGGRWEGARRAAGPRSSALPLPAGDVAVRVLPGPLDGWFDEASRQRSWQAAFSISVHSDRAGVRLTGPAVPSRRVEMLSDGLLPGAIQVPAGGQPNVLMGGGPTTDG